ncbi:MAG: type I restriction endonuclease subunit R [Bacteroidetes bacterium B1(2017)]|nr:MAG: type I restriction endonuclease subunit R [Bacteroidetes bacterium B1(2017)]
MKNVSLTDVCDFQGGTQPPKSFWRKSNASGYVRMLQIRDFTQPEKDNIEYVKDTKNTKKCNDDDILIGRYGASIGKICTGLAGAYNVALIKTIPNKSLLNKRFLFYILKSLNFQIFILSIGSRAAQAGFNKEDLSNFQIPLPSLEEQKRIAAILDAAYLHRQKTKELIAKYDELSQALFLDMFGDPVNNPKGWEVKSLKSLSTKIHSGNTPKGGSNVYVESGITFFRSQNVWKNNLIYEDIAYIDQETHNKMTKSSLKYGDLLMTKTGRFNTENSSLGRAAIYLGHDDMANVNGHVYLIRLKKGQVNKFILHILTSIQFRDLIRRVCVGGIDKRQLNKNHIEDFPIVTPPKMLQEKFITLLELIENQKSQAIQGHQKAEELFQSLLQKAFKGEL